MLEGDFDESEKLTKFLSHDQKDGCLHSSRSQFRLPLPNLHLHGDPRTPKLLCAYIGPYGVVFHANKPGV